MGAISSSSGGSAYIMFDNGSDLRIANVQGDFNINDTITGGDSGATANLDYFETSKSSILIGNNNSNNTFTHSSNMQYLNINSNLQGKTIDDVTYPIVFNTYFKKEIIQASNGNYYIKTFDGTTDQYILIP